MNPSQKTIIWDWNGTLLDDLSICLESINCMLEVRNLEKLSREKYRSVFTFPVIEYYRKVGFDFETEDWEQVAMEFMGNFFERLASCPLFPDAIKALDFFRDRGFRQIILSAMEQDALTSSVHTRGIGKYFQQVIGIDNHYAAGKSGNGLALMEKHTLNKENTWFVGDTLHDAEIAGDLGCQCLLVVNGHQSKDRLVKAGVPILDSLANLTTFFPSKFPAK
jgi:phosphoglycolate phosphatase